MYGTDGQTDCDNEPHTLLCQKDFTLVIARHTDWETKENPLHPEENNWYEINLLATDFFFFKF